MHPTASRTPCDTGSAGPPSGFGAGAIAGSPGFRGPVRPSVAAGIAGHECASGFPAVAQYTEALPFRLFAGAMMVQAAVLWRYFPETRGVALETMEGTVEGRK